MEHLHQQEKIPNIESDESFLAEYKDLIRVELREDETDYHGLKAADLNEVVKLRLAVIRTLLAEKMKEIADCNQVDSPKVFFRDCLKLGHVADSPDGFNRSTGSNPDFDANLDAQKYEAELVALYNELCE
jgi:hypothetical protein